MTDRLDWDTLSVCLREGNIKEFYISIYTAVGWISGNGQDRLVIRKRRDDNTQKEWRENPLVTDEAQSLVYKQPTVCNLARRRRRATGNEFDTASKSSSHLNLMTWLFITGFVKFIQSLPNLSRIYWWRIHQKEALLFGRLSRFTVNSFLGLNHLWSFVDVCPSFLESSHQQRLPFLQQLRKTEKLWRTDGRTGGKWEWRAGGFI